ncbi:MAG: MerR family transcriptional regulator [Pseudomonadota bacterium]
MAGQTGVNIETIRYYERIGLLSAPPRSMGKHRLYLGEHLQQLVFVRRARSLGFSLAQIRSLIELSGKRCFACEQVKALTVQHIDEVRKKIEDLHKLERTLTELVEKCQPNSAQDCPIIDALSD